MSLTRLGRQACKSLSRSCSSTQLRSSIVMSACLLSSRAFPNLASISQQPWPAAAASTHVKLFQSARDSCSYSLYPNTGIHSAALREEVSTSAMRQSRAFSLLMSNQRDFPSQECVEPVHLRRTHCLPSQHKMCNNNQTSADHPQWQTSFAQQEYRVAAEHRSLTTSSIVQPSPTHVVQSSSETSAEQDKCVGNHVQRSRYKFSKTLCKFPGCTVCPSFNMDGLSQRLYCLLHKLPGMVDVVSKRCGHSTCSKQPSFNMLGASGGLYCSAHKQHGMVNVVSRRCKHPDCKTQAYFNFFGRKAGDYCVIHKQPSMVDVRNKRCNHQDCSKQPAFNIEGAVGRYCATHKQPGMVNVKSRRCEHLDCTKMPCFNVEGSSRGRFCGSHRQAEMVDVTNKKCQHTTCQIQASFGLLGKRKRQFCAAHKQPGMINMTLKSFS